METEDMLSTQVRSNIVYRQDTVPDFYRTIFIRLREEHKVTLLHVWGRFAAARGGNI